MGRVLVFMLWLVLMVGLGCGQSPQSPKATDQQINKPEGNVLKQHLITDEGGTRTMTVPQGASLVSPGVPVPAAPGVREPMQILPKR